MKERIEKVLDEIRHILQADGGDVQFIHVTDDGIVQIHIKGTCDTCTSSMMTLKWGIEQLVMEQIPEVKKVITV